MLETHMQLCVTEPDFPEKSFAQKIGKMGQKQIVLNILKNFGINFYWICSIMKIYICCVPAQIPEIWAKMFSANQIAGFFNQPYLQNKSMK